MKYYKMVAQLAGGVKKVGMRGEFLKSNNQLCICAEG